MRIKKLFLFLFFVVPTFISCSPTDDPESATGTPIRFSTAEVAQTKADEVLTTDNLLSMGVFAYHTKQSNWNIGATPNFMHNQLVERASSSDPWTYAPVKYWSNTPGDKVSFFAYAPHHTKATSTTIVVSDVSVAGYPYLNYTVTPQTQYQTDLLASVPLLNQTRGSSALSFKMEHKLTRVLFKVKSTDRISIHNLYVKGCVSTGTLTFTDSGSTWTTLSAETHDVKESDDASVDANTLTEVGEFFLLPRNAPSIELSFTEGGGIYETLTADLPASPVWEAGGTVVYTLNIECKTEVSMTVTAWATGGSTGNMGQELPSGTTYPTMKDGVIYESAGKMYVLGNILTDRWYNYDASAARCTDYSAGYADKWRLPNIEELGIIIGLNQGLNSTYWSSTPDPGNSNNMYVYNALSKKSYSKGSGSCRGLCIRDLP